MQKYERVNKNTRTGDVIHVYVLLRVFYSSLSDVLHDLNLA